MNIEQSIPQNPAAPDRVKLLAGTVFTSSNSSPDTFDRSVDAPGSSPDVSGISQLTLLLAV